MLHEQRWKWLTDFSGLVCYLAFKSYPILLSAANLRALYPQQGLQVRQYPLLMHRGPKDRSEAKGQAKPVGALGT